MGAWGTAYNECDDYFNERAAVLQPMFDRLEARLDEYRDWPNELISSLRPELMVIIDLGDRIEALVMMGQREVGGRRGGHRVVLVAEQVGGHGVERVRALATGGGEAGCNVLVTVVNTVDVSATITVVLMVGAAASWRRRTSARGSHGAGMAWAKSGKRRGRPVISR